MCEGGTATPDRIEGREWRVGGTEEGVGRGDIYHEGEREPTPSKRLGRSTTDGPGTGCVPGS